MDEDSGAVRVVFRFRPQNKREIELKSPVCIDVPPPAPKEKKSKKEPVPTVAVLSPGGSDRTFVYDHVFDINAHQASVYEYAAKPIVDCVLKGFNGTVMAYGQTGSGKTYSMQGTVDFEKPPGEDEGVLTEGMGVIPRMIHTVFNHIACADEAMEFQLKLSIFEIYMEQIKDLLDSSGKRDNLKVREDKVRGVFVDDLTEWSVASVEEVFHCMRIGQKHRSVASTKMNATSSRSHMVFQLTIIQRNAFDLSQKVGKLYMVDLAGSEKLSKTGADGMTMEEGKLINKSLSCLGNVINALTNPKGAGHIPYRDSKLTRVLQDSLGGNSQTCLICTASPALDNEAETLSTMRFGQRAKCIQNKPVINEERSVEELERLLNIANATVSDQEAWIDTLEEFVKGKGLSLPAKAKKKKEDKKGDEGKDEEENEEDYEEQIEALKHKLKIQSEQITAVSAELGTALERVATLEGHTRTMEEKLADGTGSEQAEALKEEHSHQLMKLELELQSAQEQAKLYKEKFEAEVEARRAGADIAQQNERALALQNVEREAAEKVEKDFKGTASIDVSAVADAKLAAKIKDLIDVNEKLEKEVQVEKLKSQKLKEVIRDGEKPLRHKLTQLDKSLEHLTVTYQKLTSQNGALKVEVQMAEKKHQRKEQQVAKLEKNLAEARARYEKLCNQCATLTSALEQLQKAGFIMTPPSAMGPKGLGEGMLPVRRPNVSRSLRGGQKLGAALDAPEKKEDAPSTGS